MRATSLSTADNDAKPKRGKVALRFVKTSILFADGSRFAAVKDYGPSASDQGAEYKRLKWYIPRFTMFGFSTSQHFAARTVAAELNFTHGNAAQYKWTSKTELAAR